MRSRDENIQHCRAIFQEKRRAKFERIARNKELCDNMTPSQRLDRLNDRLGFGVGARKERAKLARKLPGVMDGLEQARKRGFVPGPELN